MRTKEINLSQVRRGMTVTVHKLQAKEEIRPQAAIGHRADRGNEGLLPIQRPFRRPDRLSDSRHGGGAEKRGRGTDSRAGV